MGTARYRTKTSEVVYGVMKYYGTTGVLATSPNYVAKSETASMSDYVDTGFYGRRLSGEVFNNPCEYVRNRRDLSEISNTFRYWVTNVPNQVGYSVSGNVTAFQLARCSWYAFDVPNSLEPSLDTAAVAKQFALANVDSTPYEFFEDIGEIGETIRFLRNPLAAINDLAKNFSRKKRLLPGWPKPLAKDLANLWNQYRFAFLPLCRSLMSAMDALANFKGRSRPERRTAHGFCNAETHNSELANPWTMSPNPVIYQYRKECTYSKNSHAAIYYEVSNPAANLSFYLGLRLKDVPVVMWELMPLSFMVDRLYNVKNMLSGLLNLADPAVSILAASITERPVQTAKITNLGRYWSLGEYTWQNGQTPDYVIYTIDGFKRSVWVPKAVDVLPTLTYRNLVNDTSKILDLIAIAISRLL